jgi:hypothetical protein
LLAAPARAGGGGAAGSEFQVNAYTTGYQIVPSVAADGGGDFVVAWESFDQAYTNFDVYCQRFNSSGSRLGREIWVTRFATGGHHAPSVGMDGTGNFVVVWQGLGPIGPHDSILGQRYAATGAPVGASFQISTYTGWHETAPDVSFVEGGGFVVVWKTFQGGTDIVGRRYDAAGSPLGDEFPVSTYTGSFQERPAVASDSSGNFVVVWQSQAQDGSGRGVFGRRFDALGTPLGGEFAVNTYTTDDQGRPSVAADDAGSFVVVWETDSSYGTNEDIHGRRYDPAGNPLGGEFQVNTYTWHRQRKPSVAVVEGNGFVVVWTSVFQDGAADGVFGQRYDAEGAPHGGEFQINTHTTGTQSYPAVAAQAGGDFVVVWEGSPHEGGWYTDVFGQRYERGIFADGFEVGDTSAWSAVFP